MSYDHFRYARRVDADTIGVYKNDMTKLLQIDDATANTIKLKGGSETSGDDLIIYANSTDGRSNITLNANGSIDFVNTAGANTKWYFSSNLANYIGEGFFRFKEITTPTAVNDFGAIYTKADNKLYFQDGANAEHEIQFA